MIKTLVHIINLRLYLLTKIIKIRKNRSNSRFFRNNTNRAWFYKKKEFKETKNVF